MDFNKSKRDFLYKTAISGAAVAGLLTLGGCERILQQIQNRPIRKNINSLASNDPIILALKDAVSQMKALPPSNALSWSMQAQIHNDFCPHGNWYFLPWHRAYLKYFEDICRSLSGYDDFALPYWDWSCNPNVPSHYWGGSSNPLYNNTRSINSSSTAPPGSVGTTTMNNIMGLNNFEQFASYSAPSLRPGTTYGQLEQTPHNTIHGWVGGDMVTFHSPLDAVFWAHHNMIEYCWVEWNMNMGNANTNDSAWTNMSLGGMFYDTSGIIINNITVATTLLMPLLSYQYEGPFIPCGSTGGRPEVAVDSANLREFLEKGAPSKITSLHKIKLRKTKQLFLNRSISSEISIPRENKSMLVKTTESRRLLLTVKDVSIKGDIDVFVRVFINKPSATASTSIDDPHYAGSFSFFAINQDHPHKLEYSIDITDTLKRIERKLGSSAKLDIQLVTVPLHQKANRRLDLTIGGFDIDLSEIE